MERKRGAVAAAGVTILILAVGALQGCTYGKESMTDYLKGRYKDAAEILEVGITLSWKPGFALYADGVSVLPGGWGYVDGYFVGLGGGQIGITRFYQRSVGLLVWGQEKVGWGDFNVDDETTLNTQGVGVLGILVGPHGIPSQVGIMGPAPGPDYFPACVHYIHLGFVGAVANLRYLQALDFLAGFFSIDMFDDNHHQLGRWPWQRRAEPVKAAVSATSDDKKSVRKERSDAPGAEPAPPKKDPPKKTNPAAAPAPAKPVAEDSGDNRAVASSSANSPPARIASPPAPPADPVPAPKRNGRVASVGGVKYHVQTGDTFYGIAARLYGDGGRWHVIYNENRNRLKLSSPKSLRQGSVLIIPPIE
jgi:hypothetical protein